MTVTLKRDGFWVEESKKVDGEWTTELKRASLDVDFVSLFRRYLLIEDDVTVGDFFSILEEMEKTGLLTFIELLTDSTWSEHLKTWRDEPPKQEREDEDPLEAVEVYQWFEMSNHDDIESFHAGDVHSGCHGIGKSGTAYAIEFNEWSTLRDLRLRASPKMTVSRMVWKKGKRRKVISNGGDEDWNFSDKDVDRRKTKHEDVRCTISLGNFFHGVASELCFFSTPEYQRKQQEKLHEALAEVRRPDFVGVSMDDVFSKMKKTLSGSGSV